MLMSFLSDESGATAIEYSLVASLIGLAIIGALTTIGTATQQPLNTVSAEL